MDELERLLDEKGIDRATLRRLFGEGTDAVYAVTRSGAEAIDAWHRFRDALEGAGWWPVVLGAEESVRRIGEDLQFNLEDSSPRRVVERGIALDTDAWLAEHTSDDEPAPDDESEWEVEPGPNEAYTIASDVLTGEPFARVAIALVPTATAWEVPAYLGIGGWNDCPSPEVHVAMLRRWHERHGAEIVGYSGDVVELRVARPVEDPDDARALAREQYAYCGDIVDQGLGTLDVLADTLVGSTVWYFWWD